MDANVNAGILAMRKANAERAAAKARAGAGGEHSPRKTATVKARVEAPAMHSWRVALERDGALAWVGVEAPGPQRAMRAARKANPGALVCGVVRAAIKGATIG